MGLMFLYEMLADFKNYQLVFLLPGSAGEHPAGIGRND